MAERTPEPCPANGFMAGHAALLLRCHRHWTGRDLIDPGLAPAAAAEALYHAPVVVLSHDTAADPLFNYANLAAQQLFELPWAEIVGMPSRFSAEPMAREERERLLARVATHGYIDDYCGVRIAKSGRRFHIRDATVWNLFGDAAVPLGQAACFSHWHGLE